MSDPSPAEPASWDGRRERGVLLGLRLTVAFYRLVGGRLAWLLVLPVVSYFFLTDRSGRAASRAYLQRVWSHPEGRRALERSPGFWSSYRHYRAFARSILDRLEMWFGHEERFRFTFEGREQVTRYLDAGQGVLVLGAHLGSFDALRALARVDSTPVNVAMYTQHAAHINRIFREISPHTELRVIHLEPGSAHSLLAIRRCLGRGEIVALLADRVAPGDQGRRRDVSFLGERAPFPLGPFELAGLLGCPVALMLALRRGRRDYAVSAEILAPPQASARPEREAAAGKLLERYVERLEAAALQAPFQWFNFFDFWAEGRRSSTGGAK